MRLNSERAADVAAHIAELCRLGYRKRIHEELESILSSEPFQSSRRSQELLRYLVEKSLDGQFEALKERIIGIELFGRDPDYPTSDDAIVRVAANDVRKRLAAYYASGQGQLRISLRPGAYIPEIEVLKSATPDAPAAPPETPHQEIAPPRPSILHWKIATALLAVALVWTAVLAFSSRRELPAARASSSVPPWPLSRVVNDSHPTRIIVADANYGLIQMVSGLPGSLEAYMKPNYPRDWLRGGPLLRSRLVEAYLASARLTSCADLAVILKMIKAVGPLAGRVSVSSARDFSVRDMKDGNYIFLGSPATNPWVSLFEDRLDFREEPHTAGGLHAFVNRRPLPSEKRRYEGLQRTGQSGEDYAAVALIPNAGREGAILILQGLQQEGTEAAGEFLASREGGRTLREALKLPDSKLATVWFEALLRTRTVAGGTSATEIVAAHVH